MSDIVGQRSSVGEMLSRMAAVLYQRVRGFLWFSRAASGMYAPGHGKVSIPLPGHHSSQRAEIAALLLSKLSGALSISFQIAPSPLKGF
jgi:hypothetical protein